MSYKGKWEAQDRNSPDMNDIQYIGVDLNKELYPYVINMPSPPFAVGRCGAIITSDPMNPDGAKANAQLIVSAVNACAGVNPDNPQIVAESISDLYEALKAMMLPQQINNGKVVVRSTPSSQAILMSQQALAKVEEK